MNSNVLKVIVLSVLFCAAGVSARAVPVNNLFNTGVDNHGSVLPFGTIDPHYTVTGAAAQAYVVALPYTQGSFAWATPTADAWWIGPNSDPSVHWPADPEGLYHYRITFDILGGHANELRLDGKWATDNDSTILLNGHPTGLTKGILGFGSLETFSLTTGFVDGLNVIEFQVDNCCAALGGNPSGLLVADLKASWLDGGTDASHGVPDGGVTASLLLLALGSMTLVRHHSTATLRAST